MEQRDFLKAKDIRLGRQFFILLANGAVFATQFFAIRKMVDVSFCIFDSKLNQSTINMWGRTKFSHSMLSSNVALMR